MTIEYTWNLGPIEVSPELQDEDTNDIEGVIRVVHWQYIGEEDGKQAWVHGSTSTGIYEPDTFVPFDEVPREMVLQWITSSEGITVEGLQEQITQQLHWKQGKETVDCPWDEAE